MSNTERLTDAMISALDTEARSAGDLEQVRICSVALMGDSDARPARPRKGRAFGGVSLRIRITTAVLASLALALALSACDFMTSYSCEPQPDGSLLCRCADNILCDHPGFGACSACECAQ